MHNADIIHLTEKGEEKARTLAEYEFGDARDDVVSYLITKEGYKAPCEEIGMNAKILAENLKEAIDKLEREGYIAVQNLDGHEAHHMRRSKCDDEPLPKWDCKSCGTVNIAHTQDPRSVHCSSCGARHTVTGRDIHGKLYVQQFSMR